MSIKVLIVEDSRVVRELLMYILGSDPEIQVIGTANNGEEALQALNKLQPDVVTMDINMPVMDGYEATRRIMETHPRPIVIVSVSVDAEQIASTFQALEAGALAAVQKPTGIGHPDHEETARTLIKMVKLMSEVKVVRRWARRAEKEPVSSLQPKLEEGSKSPGGDIKIIAVGASTGGPPVLRAILSGLPSDFPVPVLIVQHMSPGFISGFADLLAQSCRLPIHVAVHMEPILPGHVYLAPDGLQMGVGNGGSRIDLTPNDPEEGLRPATSYLFRSVAEIYGCKAVGVLLTGMGKDGAKELKLMKAKGSVTIAQDKESSVIFGMPGEAVKLDAAVHVLPPAKITELLIRLTSGRRWKCF